jgi:hypothetical protein
VEAAADVVVVVATVVAAAVVVVTEATAVVAEVATKSSLRKFSKAATKVAAFFYFVPQLIRHKSVIPNSCAEPAGERDLTKLVQHQQRCEDRDISLWRAISRMHAAVTFPYASLPGNQHRTVPHARASAPIRDDTQSTYVSLRSRRKLCVLCG